MESSHLGGDASTIATIIIVTAIVSLVTTIVITSTSSVPITVATISIIMTMIIIMLCSWCFYDIGLQFARFDRLNFLLLPSLALL